MSESSSTADDRSAPPMGADPSVQLSGHGAAAEPSGHGAASERTGLPDVDRVLAEIESVGELPVAARVEVFERAHERLRRALDADPTSEIAGAVKE